MFNKSKLMLHLEYLGPRTAWPNYTKLEIIYGPKLMTYRLLLTAAGWPLSNFIFESNCSCLLDVVNYIDIQCVIIYLKCVVRKCNFLFKTNEDEEKKMFKLTEKVNKRTTNEYYTSKNKNELNNRYKYKIGYCNIFLAKCRIDKI